MPDQPDQSERSQAEKGSIAAKAERSARKYLGAASPLVGVARVIAEVVENVLVLVARLKLALLALTVVLVLVAALLVLAVIFLLRQL